MISATNPRDLAGVRQLVTVAIFCAIALLLTVRPAAAQETTPTPLATGAPITIEALVLNGTAGTDAPAGLIVTLQVFDSEDNELQRLEAEVDADDFASFDGVIGDREVIYALSAAYRDIRFFSDAYISSIEREGPLELIVFETTADPSVIRIIGDSSAITPPADDSGVLRVLQVTTFENVSDRAYVGNDPLNTRLTVVLPLPTMAFDLESVHSPGSLVLAPEGRNVHSIIPVMPGIEEYIVTYGVLYTTEVFAWSKAYPYSTEVVRLLVPPEISFRPGSEWIEMPDSEVSGVTYARYEMRSVIAGETLFGTVADLPLSAGARSRSLERTLRDIALGVAAAALITAAAFAVYWARYRGRRRGPSSTAADQEAMRAQREAALAELARLEDAREAGEMTQEEHAAAAAPHRDILRRILEGERGQ